MNIDTKVNTLLLSNHLRGANLSSTDHVNIGFWNQGKGRQQSKVFIYLIVSAILYALGAMFAGNKALAGIAGVAICGFVWAYIIEFRKESRNGRIFKEACDQVKRHEIVMEAIFPDYDRICNRAREICKNDVDAWSMVLDWTRAEILNLIVTIEEGKESTRGELRISFRVAHDLFGDALDLGHGYDLFFSREILDSMKKFIGTHKEVPKK